MTIMDYIIQWYNTLSQPQQTILGNVIFVVIISVLWLAGKTGGTYYTTSRTTKMHTSENKSARKYYNEVNFREDGYYWSPKENKWIAPDYEHIPKDYHWDEIECRWIPPNHPDHPRFHMNDRPLEEQGRGHTRPKMPKTETRPKPKKNPIPKQLPKECEIQINRKYPSYEEWKAQKLAEEDKATEDKRPE